MTAQATEQPTILPRPARTPAAIRAVLVANANRQIVEEFDAAWDAAFEKAKATDSLEPLTAMLKRWWLEAISWCDPVAHRAFLAQMEDWATNGVPPTVKVYSSAEVKAAWEAAHDGQPLNWALSD